MNIFTKIIAKQLLLPQDSVDNTLKLLDEGCTIPFISRYRKERTGGLNEVQIAQISDLNEKLKETAKRKETILKTISELGKLTPELKSRINECWNATELEDIYLPYRPKRRTRAQVAREQGLEPLATILLMQREQNPMKVAEQFMPGVKTEKAATVDDIKAILDTGNPVLAWYVSAPMRDIMYRWAWLDENGELVHWPGGEHAVVVCGYDDTSLTYRDPNAGTTVIIDYDTFAKSFSELGGRIVYYAAQQ